MYGLFSTKKTLCPASAMSNAACIPAIPAPITNTLLFVGVDIGYSDSFNFSFSIIDLIIRIAFLVPSSLLE